jgi:RND family efflux transporter MFP subunit
MSSEPIKTPSRRRLRIVGIVALTVAAGVAAVGILVRNSSDRTVAQWTDQQAVPTVALAKLDTDTASATLTLPGNIQAWNQASIYARVPGYLKTWQSDIGARVKAGDTLATIDTPDLDQQLDQAQAELATAQANEQLAAVTAQRWKDLLPKQAVSQQAVDEKVGDAMAKKAIVDSMQANVRRLQTMERFKNITAPFDGVVTARNTDIGELINAGNAGQELFEVSDLHRVRVYVQVPQAFASQIQPGTKATFELPQYPGRQFHATVVTSSNALDSQSRSMLVELDADNADGALAANAYSQVHLELPGDPGKVRLPATALIAANKGAQVAVLGSDGKATLKQVQLGRDFGDSVEVVAGLSPDDHVIDSPPETLQTGDAVQLANASRSEAVSNTPAAPTAPPAAGVEPAAAHAP